MRTVIAIAVVDLYWLGLCLVSMRYDVSNLTWWKRTLLFMSVLIGMFVVVIWAIKFVGVL